jgi:hypothetical protein
MIAREGVEKSTAAPGGESPLPETGFHSPYFSLDVRRNEKKATPEGWVGGNLFD